MPYCYDYDKEQGILVPIPERTEQARQALDLYLSGYSDAKIRDILGYTSERVVRNILTSPVNIGMIPYKGSVYRGKHEPIFEMERFEVAQEMRKSRRQHKLQNINQPAHLLTGLCYCGVCGCKMRYQKWKHGKHKIYCCSRNAGCSHLPNYNPNCDNSLEWADDIEKQVEEQILKISLNLSSYKPKERETRLEILQKQYDKEKTKLKRLYSLYADGNDTVLEMIQESESKLSEIKEQVDRETENTEYTQKKEYVYEKIKKLADVWDHIDKPDKNKILKSIISKIVIVNGNVEIQLKRF